MEKASGDEGVNIAVLPSVLNVTIPAILVPPVFFSVNVEGLTVRPCTTSSNVAVIVEATATPIAPVAGLVLTNVGVASDEIEEDKVCSDERTGDCPILVLALSDSTLVGLVFCPSLSEISPSLSDGGTDNNGHTIASNNAMLI